MPEGRGPEGRGPEGGGGGGPEERGPEERGPAGVCVVNNVNNLLGFVTLNL